MLIKLLELLQGRKATLAMLCKTAVARKVLSQTWSGELGVTDAEIHPIDAATYFDAAVDACLLICYVGTSNSGRECRVYDSLGDSTPARTIGYRDGQLIADLTSYERWKHLAGEETYRWRSGVKHDCSKVMEFWREGGRYRNGHGEVVDLEDAYLYPMLKSSELANGHTKEPTRWMLVTQRVVGEDTSVIRVEAPRTWKYLQEHGEALDLRASSIYKNRPRFSMFGIGDYTFSPWKVAISGFYKRLKFTSIGGVDGKPIVLDDTGYFVTCRTKEEATLISSLLNSEAATAFFTSFVFWDAKRPITIDLLRRLDLMAVACEFGREIDLKRFLSPGPSFNQMELFGSG